MTSTNTVTAFIFISLLYFGRGQDDNRTKSSADVLRLKYSINSTRMANLTIDLLSSMHYKKYTNDSIYLKDILNFVGISSANSTALDSIFNQIQMNMTAPFSDRMIETAFNALNISVLEAYTNFIIKMNQPISDVGIAFGRLGINVADLSNAALFIADKTQAQIEFFNILNNGNYSESNIILFLQTLNITSNELIDAIIDIIGSKDMDDIFKMGSGTANAIKLILEKVSIPANAYETYKPFATILDNYIKEINTQIILATAFTSSNFITLRQSGMENLNLSMGELYEDNNELNITNLTLVDYQNDFLNIASLRLNNSYLNISLNYSTPLQNCSVIIYSNGRPSEIKALNVTKNEEYFYAYIENENIPAVASPLICNNTILGLATSVGNNNNGSWQFKSLIKKQELTTTTTTTTITTDSTTQAIGSTTMVTHETVTATSSSNSAMFGTILTIAFFSLLPLLLH